MIKHLAPLAFFLLSSLLHAETKPPCELLPPIVVPPVLDRNDPFVCDIARQLHKIHVTSLAEQKAKGCTFPKYQLDRWERDFDESLAACPKDDKL